MSILPLLRIPGSPATNLVHAIFCINRTNHLEQRREAMEGQEELERPLDYYTNYIL